MKMVNAKLPEVNKYRKKYVYTRKYCLELQRGQVSYRKIEGKRLVKNRGIHRGYWGMGRGDRRDIDFVSRHTDYKG